MTFPSSSKTPGTEVQYKIISAPKPTAINVANSSLSENLISKLLTTSFSLAIGIMLLFQSSS